MGQLRTQRERERVAFPSYMNDIVLALTKERENRIRTLTSLAKSVRMTIGNGEIGE